MKTLLLLLIGLFFLFSTYSQEKDKSAPEVDKKCKALVDKLNALLISQDERVIKKNLSTSEYGKYVGGQLIALGLVNDFSVDDLVMACCYNHDCIGAYNLEVIAYLAGPKCPKQEKFMPFWKAIYKILSPRPIFLKLNVVNLPVKLKLETRFWTLPARSTWSITAQ